MTDKVNKIINNKKTIIILILLLIVLVGFVGTYAWFTWTSTDNTSVTLSIGKLADVTFESGPDININNLAPVFNYTDGVSTTFSINNRDTSGSSLLYRVKFNITNIDNELRNKDLKYTLLKGTSVVAEGNFSNTTNGTILNLGTSSLTNGTSNYTLYFWIDGNEENDLNMMNKNLSGTIEVSIESNILTRDSTNPSSGTSTFLNSTLTRESIESVNISGTNTEPLGSIGSFDVSNNHDNSIIMWYTDTDNDNLYEVTIGSADNGTIYANQNMFGMFSYLINVTSLDLSYLDVSNSYNMNSVFKGCTKLEELDISNFDTYKVTTMAGMFSGCSNLTYLDLTNFNTTNLESMSAMFEMCSKLTNLKIENFNTTKVTNMSYLFYNCTSLKEIDLSNFDTSNVVDMQRMFCTMSEITSLNLSNFNTNKITNVTKMFSKDNKLTIINLNNADFSNVTTSTDMFNSVPTSAIIKLKDTPGNRTLMGNFPSYNPTYVG